MGPVKKDKNFKNMFSFSVVISFQPKRLRRVSTSWAEIPCLMSALSHSSGTTPALSSPSPFLLLFQNWSASG